MISAVLDLKKYLNLEQPAGDSDNRTRSRCSHMRSKKSANGEQQAFFGCKA
jgi:hypothetical protein